MYKKIILLILTISNLYTSQKNISLLDYKYKNNRFKKALKLHAKYLLASFRKRNFNKLSKQITNYLGFMKSRENNIKEREIKNCKPENISKLLKIQEENKLYVNCGYMRIKEYGFARSLNYDFSPHEQNNPFINEKFETLTEEEKLLLFQECNKVITTRSSFSITDSKLISKLFSKIKKIGYLAVWPHPTYSPSRIPHFFFRNKNKFPWIYFLWKNLYLSLDKDQTFAKEAFLKETIFKKKVTEFFLKTQKITGRQSILSENPSEIPEELFYSPSTETFNIWEKQNDNGEYEEFYTNINIWLYLFIKKYNSISLSKLSFKNLCEFYYAFFHTQHLPKINDRKIIHDYDNFFEIAHTLIEAISIKINDAEKENLPLSNLSLFFQIINYHIKLFIYYKKDINKGFMKSIKNYILKYIQRKNIFIETVDIEKLSKDDSILRVWMENLITALQANMEPYYTELSVFLLNNPYETLIKDNWKNKDEYNKVLRTIPIVNKFQTLLAILNRPSFSKIFKK